MEKILLDLYMSRDWTLINITPTQKTEMAGLISERICHDPIGHTFRVYSLTKKGKAKAEFVLRKYGRNSPPKRGIAVEERVWHDPETSVFSPKEMEESIRKFCKSVESYRDWKAKRVRLIIKNIDTDLDSAVEPVTKCDHFIYKYLDNKRSLLRSHTWVEIILWDT